MTDHLLLSVECGRYKFESERGPGRGANHALCPGWSRAGVGLRAVCYCGCHQAEVRPEPGHRRGERMRADWATGLWRISDLARRYGVTTQGMKGILAYPRYYTRRKR